MTLAENKKEKRTKKGAPIKKKETKNSVKKKKLGKRPRSETGDTCRERTKKKTTKKLGNQKKKEEKKKKTKKKEEEEEEETEAKRKKKGRPLPKPAASSSSSSSSSKKKKKKEFAFCGRLFFVCVLTIFSCFTWFWVRFFCCCGARPRSTSPAVLGRENPVGNKRRPVKLGKTR